MLTNTYIYVRYNIYQTVYKQTKTLICLWWNNKKKRGVGGGTVLAAYLANKQHFVPFHPIKALDRPKTQAAPPSWQTSCHKAALEHALLLKPPTSKPGTPWETQHQNNRRHGFPRQPGSPTKPSKQKPQNVMTLLPCVLPTARSACTHNTTASTRRREKMPQTGCFAAATMSAKGKQSLARQARKDLAGIDTESAFVGHGCHTTPAAN